MNALCYNEACTKDFYDLSLDLNCAEAAGFDLIEMRFDCIRAFLDKGGTLAEIRDFFHKSHLKPDAVNALYIYPEFLSKNCNKVLDEAIFDNLSLLGSLNQEIGIKSCIVVSPLMKSTQETCCYEKSRIYDDCVRILSYLNQTYPYLEWIFEPVGLGRSLVKDVNDAVAIIRGVGSDKVGLALDSYNLFLKDLTSDFDFKHLSPKEIKAVHAMNGVAAPHGFNIIDQRFRRFLDDGDVLDSKLFLKEILSIGYQGMISTEVFYPGYYKDLSAGAIVKKAYKSLYDEIVNL